MVVVYFSPPSTEIFVFSLAAPSRGERTSLRNRYINRYHLHKNSSTRETSRKVATIVKETAKRFGKQVIEETVEGMRDGSMRYGLGGGNPQRGK